MWRDLVQRYAMRAREFSDAVAQLGKYAEMEPAALALLAKVKKQQATFISAADELDRHINQAIAETARRSGRTGSAAE
jgi:hypothetical protein